MKTSLIKPLLVCAGLLIGGPSQAAEIPLPGTLKAFNYCLDENQSPIVAPADLLQVCLKLHARDIDKASVGLSGRYQDTDQGLVFVLEVTNQSENRLLTGLAVDLKHTKQPEPQRLNFGPMGVLPGTVAVLPVGGLSYEPAENERSANDVGMGVAIAKGLGVELQ